MPRMGRIVLPNYPHHIVQRGHNRQVVFAVAEDYQRYLTDLRELKDAFGVKVYAYCLVSQGQTTFPCDAFNSTALFPSVCQNIDKPNAASPLNSSIGLPDNLSGITPRRHQNFHHIIDDGFAHILQITRGPSIPVRTANHRRILGQELGNVEQVGGVGKGFADGDAAVDSE